MKVTEIHNQFTLLAQQMGMKSTRAILPEQIDELINMESINYVRDIFSRKANRELNGISDNVIRLEELNSLVVNLVIDNIQQGDIMFGKGYRININTSPFEEDKKLMFVISLNSLTGEAIAKCRLIDIELVAQTQNDYHSKSVAISPICYKTFDAIEVIGMFPIGKFVLNYLKYPTPINFKEGITNELSDVAMQKVIERAVNTYNAASNNDSYEKVSNESLKLE